MHAKCDQNIPRGSRVMNIFTNCQRTDSHSDYIAGPMVVQYTSFMLSLKVVHFIKDFILWNEI